MSKKRLILYTSYEIVKRNNWASRVVTLLTPRGGGTNKEGPGGPSPSGANLSPTKIVAIFGLAGFTDSDVLQDLVNGYHPDLLVFSLSGACRPLWRQF